MMRNFIIAATVLVFVGLATLVVLRGTNMLRHESGKPDDENQATSVPTPPEPPPQFEKWPTPAAVLMLSGDQHGYLEPCGCSEKQSGGIARRSDLLKQLRSRGWPVAGLDVGGIVERTRKQTELKFIAVLDALRKLDYQGLGLGPEELRLQPAFLLTQHQPSEDGAELPFLGANLSFFGVPDLPGGPRRTAVFDLGGVRIGVTQVLGESEQADLFPEGGNTDVTFLPPVEVLPGVIDELKANGSQVLVLMSAASLDESRELAKKFPVFDLVLSSGGPEDPTGRPEKIGETLLVTVGDKGKKAGVVGIYPTAADGEKLRFDLVDLNRDRFRHDPAMDAVMAEYQQSLRDQLADVYSDLPEGFPPRPGTYVGAAKCGECHTKAFAKWKESRHSHAYESLAAGRKDFEGSWVNRQHDPECLSCHVTGWDPQEVYPYVSGFLPREIASEKGQPERFALLQAQQCENCHGPGSAHSAVMAKWLKDRSTVTNAEFAAANQSMKLELAAAEQTCVRCHDHENSPHFKFEEYWAKVRHPGRD